MSQPVGLVRAAQLTLAQVDDPAFRRTLLRALLLTTGLFAALCLVLWRALVWLPDFESTWLTALVDVSSFISLFVLLALLFPALVTAFSSLFLDDVAAAVERRHYPGDPAGTPLPFGRAVAEGTRFAAVAVALNLLVLPLYLLMFWFPPINVFIFYGLNGYLVGREYFELVAWRHLDRSAARALRKRHQLRLFSLGVAVAFLLTVPVLNLVTPILATALMVHVFKGLPRRL